MDLRLLGYSVWIWPIALIVIVEETELLVFKAMVIESAADGKPVTAEKVTFLELPVAGSRKTTAEFRVVVEFISELL